MYLLINNLNASDQAPESKDFILGFIHTKSKFNNETGCRHCSRGNPHPVGLGVARFHIAMAAYVIIFEFQLILEPSILICGSRKRSIAFGQLTSRILQKKSAGAF